ncbi:MAG: hypothetical protein ABIB46_06310 [bacterium]
MAKKLKIEVIRNKLIEQYKHDKINAIKLKERKDDHGKEQYNYYKGKYQGIGSALKLLGIELKDINILI